MTDRTELKRQLAETRAQMERLEAELERTEEWEPEDGDWVIRGMGDVFKPFGGAIFHRQFGACRPTRIQAERARDLMRVHNRALAYVQEHAPDWDGNDPHTVHFDLNMDAYDISAHADLSPDIGAVKGPEWVMEQLADDLNSGRVKL